MQKIRFFRKIVKSISDFNFSKYFVKEKLSKSIIYLLLLSLIIGALISIQQVYSFSMFINEIIESVSTDIPDFTFENGELNIDMDMPYIDISGDYIVVIDTTGETEPSILDDYPEGIFIGKDFFIKKDNYVRTNYYSFTDIKEFNFDKDKLLKLTPYLRWINIIIVIAILIFLPLSKMISCFFASLIGLIINEITKAKLKFGQIYQTAIYSITLPSIIKLVLSIFNQSIPWYFYYAIVWLYMYMFMKSSVIDNVDDILIED